MSLNWALDMKLWANPPPPFQHKIAIFLDRAQLLNPPKSALFSLIRSKNIMKKLFALTFFAWLNNIYTSDFDDQLNLQNRINL